MASKKSTWVPTPTFLYRNYLYKKIADTLPRNSYFLDVGSGNGEFLRVLSNLGFTGESVDISKEAVEYAKKQLRDVKGVTVKQGDIFKYKPSKKYDVIFCFETMEHIEKDALAMKKLYQLLKLGGTLVLSAPAHMKEWSQMDKIKGHYRRYERPEITKKLKSAGFKIKDLYTYGFPFLWFLRKVSSSGKYIKSFTQHMDQDARGRESSIQEEYSPKLKSIVTNPVLLWPAFKIMDQFIKTDLGFGYLVVAKK